MIFTIIGALSNGVRGGQWREWLGEPFDDYDVDGKPLKWRWLKSDFLNAFAYFLAALLCGFDWKISLACFVFMWIGAAPGWGDYIEALIDEKKDNVKKKRFTHLLIAFLRPYPFWWGFAGLLLRGLFWGFCLAVPMAFAGQWIVALAFLISGLTMPLAYHSAKLWIFYRISSAKNSEKRGFSWGLGEIFFGAVLWSPLDAVFIYRLHGFM